MNTQKKTQRRWMASILETSSSELPALPFKRGQRRRCIRRAAKPVLRVVHSG